MTPLLPTPNLSQGPQKDTKRLMVAYNKLRTRENQLRTILDNVPCAIVHMAYDGRILEINAMAEKVCGHARRSLLGRSFFEMCVGHRLPLRREIEITVADASNASIICTLPTIDGGSRTLEWRIEHLPDDDSFGASGWVATGVDISRRKKIEAVLHQHRQQLTQQVESHKCELSDALREKEILIREMHHRVKNNMAVINSLLQLQARSVEDHAIRAKFAESQGRIEAMAMIHESLYRSKSLARIDMASYLKRLSRTIFSSYLTDHGKVDLFINVEDIELNIDQAFPCGLIVNELITNAMKYAFPDRRQGVVIVSLARNANNRFDLRVEDDGIGMPHNVHASHCQSLGMDLVHGLAINQLGGTLEVRNMEKGVRFCIRFDARGEEPSL